MCVELVLLSDWLLIWLEVFINFLLGEITTRFQLFVVGLPHRLDKALIRPGRIDVKAEVGHCTAYQLAQMFRRFYPAEPDELGDEFARRVGSAAQNGRGGAVSAAQVQGYFMLYKDRAKEALENTQSICKL